MQVSEFDRLEYHPMAFRPLNEANNGPLLSNIARPNT